VTEDIKWDDDLVFSVGGKMFVVAMLEPPHRVSFKCDDETFAELVERDGIIPAPYLARAKWVSIESLGHGMDWRELEGRLRRSYALVKASLPKRAQAAIDAAPATVSARRRRSPG
jgi:predicted DNA-binding protein (MmcQ/YjbR family)